MDLDTFHALLGTVVDEYHGFGEFAFQSLVQIQPLDSVFVCGVCENLALSPLL